jgi:hypothetical protein
VRVEQEPHRSAPVSVKQVLREWHAEVAYGQDGVSPESMYYFL